MSDYLDLSFDTLRGANEARIPQFRNAVGDRAHNKDGSDWSINDWYTALMGEAGELGNILKKVRRGDFSLDEAHEEIAEELADIITYADIFAKRCRINLGDAVRAKFNIVSRRNGCSIFINGNKWYEEISSDR